MNLPDEELCIQPAQLAFLAIYNPDLGPTDESFSEQLVYYYTRPAVVHAGTKANNRNAKERDDARRAEENERLRQIGLAQGMVNFARSFSNGESVDSIDTDRTRIVLRELEKGWWILAEASTKANVKSPSRPSYEYSSREVSPSLLLTQQLMQAHHVFLLHHGPSLDELFVRLKRDKFCATVDRYWSRFTRLWNVLLHDNPAVDAFDAVKVSSGGELGFGVGEEEWGSGERDVLENLVQQTEGMVDLVVSRFGDSVPRPPEVGKNLQIEPEAVPWMGSGQAPTSMDGVVFSGTGAITRPSLRSLSLWTRQIYSYGEHAYGVYDNPSRERYKRRRVLSSTVGPTTNTSTQTSKNLQNDSATDSQPRSRSKLDSGRADASSGSMRSTITPKRQAQGQKSLSRRNPAAELKRTPTSTGSSAIPQPIVSAAEQALNDATRRADEDAQSQYEKTKNDGSGTTMGIPDEYMKYLTFGLSTFAKAPVEKHSPASPDTSAVSSQTTPSQRLATGPGVVHNKDDGDSDADEPKMTQVDPIPDGATAIARSLKQQRLESQGHFLVGLKGALNSRNGLTDGEYTASETDNDDGARKVIRTLYIEVTRKKTEGTALDRDSGLNPELKEMLLANHADRDLQRLRVLVYVHRPFVYCLLFESQTTSLQYSKLYNDIHHSLLPIHKSLIASTSAVKVSQRVDASLSAQDDSASLRSVTRSSTNSESDTSDIYDLLYDPRTLSLHTTIPNVPDPGTPAAEGFIAGLARDTQHTWTRVDAMNVHSQLLSTLSSAQWGDNDLEKSSKTSRGWWVVWLKLPLNTTDADQTSSAASTASVGRSDLPSGATVPLPSTMAPVAPEPHRIAFLVRKAVESNPVVNTSVGSRAMAGLFGALSLRSSSTTDDRGAKMGPGPGTLAGGIGVDARQYVEGLFPLNR
nr:vacuolar fusion protein ccz1 like [Quercus suber]